MGRAAKPTRRLSHLSKAGDARMVEVGAKPETVREAVASGLVRMRRETLALLAAGQAAKGDVLAVARVAAIQAVKRTSDLIPLCHPVRVTGTDVELVPDARTKAVRIRVVVRAYDRTGVEMEALTAVTIAALTIYDMLKAVDRAMEIGEVRLERKSGGRSGLWTR